jgi:hypothetical protein
MTTPTLRPLSTPELLDRTFSIYRSRFLLFAGIIAVPNLLTLVVNLARIAADPTAFSLQSAASLSPSYFLWTLVTVVVSLAVLAASMGATAIGVSHVYLDRPITVVDALSRVMRRVPRLVLMMLIVGVAVVGLPLVAVMITALLAAIAWPLALIGVPLVIGGLIFAVVDALMWSLAVPVAAIEDKGILAAFARSTQLTRGDRLRILLVVFLFVVIIWVVQILITLPVGILAFFYATTRGGTMGFIPPWLQVFTVVSSLIAQCVVGPLMTIAFVVLYYDNRVRKEAFDLELMMADVDGPPRNA